jgi:hypothetical protein
VGVRVFVSVTVGFAVCMWVGVVALMEGGLFPILGSQLRGTGLRRAACEERDVPADRCRSVAKRVTSISSRRSGRFGLNSQTDHAPITPPSRPHHAPITARPRRAHGQ